MLNVGRNIAQQLELINEFKGDILAIPEPHIGKNNKLTGNNVSYHILCQKDIAVIYKKNIPIQIVKTEGYYIAITVTNYIIISCYFAPSKDLEEQLRNISKLIVDFRNFKIILMGDFNVRSNIYEKINREDYNMKIRAELFEEFLMSHDLIVKNPYNVKTFNNANGSSVIDLIVVQQIISERVGNIKIDDTKMTPHSEVGFEFEIEGFKYTKEEFYKLNENKFKSAIEINRNKINEIVVEIYNCKKNTQLEKKITVFNELLSKLGDECREAVQKNEKTWWNNELEKIKLSIKILKKRTDKYLRKYKRASLNENKNKYIGIYQIHKQTLKHLTLKYKRMIMECKTKAWKEFVEGATVWGSPYKVLLNKYQKLELPVLQINSCNLTTEQEKYEYLINEIFPIVNEKLPEYENDSVLELDYEFLDQIIKNLKNKKANGADKISNRMLKILHGSNKWYLRTIYEKCLELVYFPKTWKKGKLKILNKPGKKPVNAKAFRPLTLLPCLGKVLEKIIKSHLEKALYRNFVLHENQFAYRKKCGTEQAVLKFTKFADDFKSRNRHVFLMSFDLSGAFNRVLWSTIIKTLADNQIPHTLINFIKSFLTERTIGHYDSEGNTITQRSIYCGVPQGSVLGPTLFNVVMAKVHRTPYYKDLKIISYADDILMISGINDLETDTQKINDTAENLSSVLKSAGLSFNSEKTQSLLISSKHDKNSVKQCIETKVRVDKCNVKVEKELKYLGVILDEKLSFSSHVDYINKKILKYYNIFRALYGNRFGLNYKNRKILYNAIFTSITSYCSIVYFPRLSQTQQNKIKTLQRKILINIASGYRTISYNAIYCITGELPIDLKIWIVNEMKKFKMEKQNFGKLELREKLYEFTDSALQKWQANYENSINGKHTIKLIPNLKIVFKNRSWFLNYHITQAITGHGNFATYLNKYKITNNSICPNCKTEYDTPWHTIVECPNFYRLRREYGINEENVILNNKKMLIKTLKYFNVLIRNKNKM